MWRLDRRHIGEMRAVTGRVCLHRRTNLEVENAYVAPGMPPLQQGGRAVSFFEFWPMWVMYVPVVLQWLLLAVRYRSLTLPLIANPVLPVSGMVGVGKSAIFSQATGSCAEAIVPWVLHRISAESSDSETEQLTMKALDRGIQYPYVCKPDIGCRGSGVKLIHNRRQLEDYLCNYPKGSDIIVQKLASWEAEAGVFYTRRPGEAKGRVVSLALKYSPHVVGDGVSTLAELIARDSRAGHLKHLYTERHDANLGDVLGRGEVYRLVFSISHCRGAIFRDGGHLITTELTKQIDQLMSQIPEFYYGRLDIKFSNIDELKQGKSIEIIEINSASSESLHIWDRGARLTTAITTLLWQYRTLFELGALNRKRGHKPPKISEILKRWRDEKRLAKYHPPTD